MTATATKIDLVTIIGEKKKAYIDGTTLRGGTTINERKVNYKIGNALRKLRFGDFQFTRGDVYLDDLMEDAEGYLFKKSGKTIFLAWDSSKKRISEMYLSHSFVQIEDEDILQALLCLEIVEDLTNFGLKTKSEVIFSEKDIEKESPESEMFANCVFQVEDAIEQKILFIHNVSDDTFSINAGEVDLNSFIIPSPVIKHENNRKENEETILGERKSRNRKDYSPTQVDLFESKDEMVETFTGVQSQSVEQDSTQKKNSIQKSELPAKVCTSITLDEARKQRPLFFDDLWVSEKLKTMGIERKLIDVVIKYREAQRCLMTPEQIMYVPAKAKFTGESEPLEMALVALLTGNNLIIKGETGTGKTTLTKSVDCILNRPLYLANGSADASIETFIGFKKLENGDISVTDAPLIRAMENGGTLYIDEGNAVLPSVMIIMHSAFDEERQIYNEMSGELIYAHSEFRFVTSVNEEYSGTHEMNDATMDRVVAIEMTYLKPQELRNLLANFDGNFSEFQKEVIKMGEISRADLDILVEIAKAFQEGVKTGLLSPKVASIRNIIALLKLSRMTSWLKACKMIVRKYKDERSAIASILEGIEPLELSASQLLQF